MIKIKDNIFNENEIEAICPTDYHGAGGLKICFKNDFNIIVDNATFDDIQWEYDRFRVEADKDGVIFANRILEKKIKELEEENKELKNLPFIQYQKAILKITEVLDTKSIFIRKKKIKRILEEYYYESN